mmetsp:Transcript_18229/g.25930  ORF Transcript_18229/g.25930 Transcript_18229/m.25930 type:complete len:299 (+) Transcript_18229:189-1085(+)
MPVTTRAMAAVDTNEDDPTCASNVVVKNPPSIAIQLATPSRVKIVRIVLPSTNFSQVEFMKCIQQIMMMGECWDLDRNISGLYRESDSMFFPLTYILSEPEKFVKDTFCVTIYTPPPTKLSSYSQRIRAWQQAQRKMSLLLFLISVILLYTYVYFNKEGVDTNFYRGDVAMIVDKCWAFVARGLVNKSLLALYRHGPSVIGWEGLSYPLICSRVTLYGNEEFWSKNYEECAAIYNAKELSFLAFTRPLVYLFFFLFLMVAIVRGTRRRQPPLDPNMVETFRSIQMLARQLKRAFEMAG